MPTARSLSERSPVSVMRWSDDQSSCSSSVDCNFRGKASMPLTKHNVSFRPTNQVIEIPHINNLSDKVVAAVWYNPKEYSEIKAAYQATIEKMEKGEDILEPEYTSRGLEYRTQAGAWARYENKRDAYNSVLDEQDDQWQKDIDDQEAISNAYLDHSRKCHKAAALKGMKDYEEIREYAMTPTPEPEKLKLKKKKKKSSSKPSLKDGLKKESKEKRTSRSKERKSDSSGSSELSQKQLDKARPSMKVSELRQEIKREIEQKKQDNSETVQKKNMLREEIKREIEKKQAQSKSSRMVPTNALREEIKREIEKKQQGKAPRVVPRNTLREEIKREIEKKQHVKAGAKQRHPST